MEFHQYKLYIEINILRAWSLMLYQDTVVWGQLFSGKYFSKTVSHALGTSSFIVVFVLMFLCIVYHTFCSYHISHTWVWLLLYRSETDKNMYLMNWQNIVQIIRLNKDPFWMCFSVMFFLVIYAEFIRTDTTEIAFTKWRVIDLFGSKENTRTNHIRDNRPWNSDQGTVQFIGLRCFQPCKMVYYT